MLDPEEEYVLSGMKEDMEVGNGPPRVIHLRLNADMLAELQQQSSSNSSSSISIMMSSNKEESSTIFTINNNEHSLQRSQEATPHQIYQLQGNSLYNGYEKLLSIGEIKTKFVARFRNDSTASSSATNKLKEMREAEEARKSEHRAIVLNKAPLMKKSASSTLKLKAKPSVATPFARSRSSTPIIESKSNFGTSSTNGSVIKSSPLKRENSALQRQVVQILAKGPQNGKVLIQQVKCSEQELLNILTLVANKQSSNQNRTIPTNRRRSISTSSIESENEYCLRDEFYKDVKIKDWDQYKIEEKYQVSNLMKSALDRMKLSESAPERLQLVNSIVMDRQIQKIHNYHEKLDDGSELSEEDVLMSDVNVGNSNSNRKTSKKLTSKERIAKAAKGRGSSVMSKSKSNSNGNSNNGNSGNGNLKSTIFEKNQSEEISSRKKISKKKPLSKVVKRKDIQYTDSSDNNDDYDRNDNENNDNNENKEINLKNSRKLVGRGAILTSEPWLEVRTSREWNELAKKFQKLYLEYRLNLDLIEKEEEMIEKDLKEAKSEKGNDEKSILNLPNSELEEKEEGEVSPIIEQVENDKTIDDVGQEDEAEEDDENNSFIWRNSENNKDQDSKPISLKELKNLVENVLNLQGQLSRIKIALETSKLKLES